MAAFLVAFIALPARVMGGFARFPSDLGDGRLNAYFVDNVFQFLSGGNGSLWDLKIFHPYPYTLGFSDNLFGAAPVYVLARALTGDPFLGFMIWWYLSWLVNYAAAFWSFRKLGLSSVGATTGALVFAFALPVSSMFPWPQFAYRFGAPLAVAAWWTFLAERRWSQLVVAVAWTVWQFYCGIYMGVFTVVILSAITLGRVTALLLSSVRGTIPEVLRDWRSATRSPKPRALLVGVTCLSLLMGAMVLLLWPYLKVTQIYGLTRSYAEIQPMLPTWRTFLQNDYSLLWRGVLAKVPHPVMAWEHQFFPGLVLLVLVVAGCLWLPKGRNGRSRLRQNLPAVAMALALLVVVAATYSVRGHSVWSLVSQLPLFSAIRAVSRVSVVLLIPAGYLAGRAIDLLWEVRHRMTAALVMAGLVIEAVAVSPISTPAHEWRRSDQVSAQVPTGLPHDSVLFFAQAPGGAWWQDEVTAMWAARTLNLTTMNGYSGGAPPGLTMTFGGDCSEATTRVLTYLAFEGRPEDLGAYREAMSHVVPIGFSACQASWWLAPPKSTNEGTGPTSAQVKELRVAVGSRTATVVTTATQADVTLTNGGESTVISGGVQPIRLWFRYLDSQSVALTPWVGEGATLRFDLAPGDAGTVALPLDPAYLVSGGRVDVLLSNQGPEPPPLTMPPSVSIPVR